MKKRLLAFAAATGMLFAAGTHAAADGPVELRIASFGQQSSWYAYAVGLGEMLRETLPPGSTIDTPPSGGGTQNPLLVAQDKFELAFGMAVISGWARDGAVVYDEKLDNLRALVGGFDQYYLLPLVNSSGAEGTLDQYVNETNPQARIILFRRGSAGGEGGRQVLRLMGADEDTVAGRGGNYEFAGSFGVIQNQLAADNADVWIHTITVGHPGMTEAALRGGVSFLAPSEETLAKMQEQYSWVPAKLPAGSFEGQTAELRLPGTSTLLFTSADMSDDVAYTITKTICEDMERFKSYHRALARFDCREGMKPDVVMLPLHPGAERYFREKGWM